MSASIKRDDGRCFKVADTPAEDGGARASEKLIGYIKTIGLFRNEGEERHRISEQAADRCTMVAKYRHDARGAGEPCPASAARRPTWSSTWPSASPTIAVDTHIFRVGNRTGLAPGKTPAGRRTRAREGRARRLSAARPPLADPARPLRLQGGKADVRQVHHRRHLPLRAEDVGLSGKRRGARSERGSGHASRPTFAPRGFA